MPPGDPGRAQGLHNTLTAMSKLIPPEGSARRLSGYLAYAFGYGNAFVIALDSNIASDAVQLSWVADQLEHLDRARYHHVIVFFHHPPYSSGPHSGASADPVPGTGRKAPDRVEPQSVAIRTMYMPLFRKHHVRLLVTGHDHLYDHWVERYDDKGVTYRMDTLVTGGGGAPIYAYIGEPDLRAYAAASPAENIRVEHLMKPGDNPASNPHHFVLIRVDGDRLSLEVIGTGDTRVRALPQRPGEDRTRRPVASSDRRRQVSERVGESEGRSPSVNEAPTGRTSSSPRRSRRRISRRSPSWCRRASSRRTRGSRRRSARTRRAGRP